MAKRVKIEGREGKIGRKKQERRKKGGSKGKERKKKGRRWGKAKAANKSGREKS